MKFFVVNNASGAEYTVKYGVPGEVSLPVATTVHKGMAKRICALLNASESVGVSAKGKVSAS